MKVLHVEVEVLLPVQLQHLLHRLHRHSLRARAAFAVVPQTAIAVFVQPFAPTSHGTVCHAHNLGSFPPLQLPGRRLQNHFLCLHHPLHFGGWDLLFADFHSSQLSPAISKRTFHLLIEADISHATDKRESVPCVSAPLHDILSRADADFGCHTRPVCLFSIPRKSS